MPDSNEPSLSGATVVAGADAPSAVPREPGVPPPLPATPSAPIQTEELVGKVLADRYRILKKLGEGGMGTVYLAEHTTINKKLAIKVLSSEYSHKQDLVDRFLQEARAASMISQENVVEITDFGSTPNGSVFFVMEYLHGEDLSQTLKSIGPLPWDRVAHIMGQICRALQAAHDSGIIHRDMKPENCYRIKRGKNDDFIKVLDFGIAKVTSDEVEGKGLTRTGMIFGTPEYMSPEQAKGERPDHRVDVYAAGVIMYELLTGRVPFTADTFMGILTKHMFEVPEAPSTIAPSAAIPPDVESIILKAMQKDREYRFQNMTEMAVAIETVGTASGGVSVVDENIVRPTEGAIQFAGAGTYPPGTETIPPTNTRGIIIGVVVAIALVFAGVFAIVGLSDNGDGEEVAPDTTPVAVAAKPDPEPTVKPLPETQKNPEPVQKVLPPQTPKITLKITTKGIDAQVLDAEDEAIYGMTNAKEGIKLEKTKDKIKLILRAPGYEDLLFETTPSRSKSFTKKLKRLKKKSKGKRRGSGSTGADAKKAPPDKPTKKEPKKKKGGLNSPDLKDPFSGKG